MLKEKKIARSYASALFELSEEMGLIPVINRDIQLIESILDENPDLKKMLASPVIKSHQKSNILNAILGEHIHELTFRFLKLLCKSLRVVYLKEVCLQFFVLYRAHMGIRTVKIRSVIQLDEDTKVRLLSMLREQLSSEIELSEVTDSKLVGGFVIQAGDQRYDASIKSKLNRLHREFEINIFSKGY